MNRVAFKITGVSAEQFVKRAFWLAWKACGGPLGMGKLQDRGPNMTEEQVFDNVAHRGDYPPIGAPCRVKDPTDLRADYVFGRMMKLSLKYIRDNVITHDGWTPDYNAFSVIYPTPRALFDAVAASFEPVKVTVEATNE